MRVTAIRYLSPRPRSFVDEGTSPSFALIVCTETTTHSLFYCPKKLCLSLKLVTREKNFPSPGPTYQEAHRSSPLPPGDFHHVLYVPRWACLSRRIRYREIKIQPANVISLLLVFQSRQFSRFITPAWVFRIILSRFILRYSFNAFYSFQIFIANRAK